MHPISIAAKRLAPARWLLPASLIVCATTALAAPPSRRLASRWDLKELGRDFPHALDAFQKADATAAAGRLAEAAAQFAAVAAMAPKSPAPTRRQCEVLVELGRREEALAACKKALEWGDAPEDYRAMVNAQMLGAHPPHVEEVVMALVVAAGLESRVSNDPSGYAATFDIARRLGDRQMMKVKLRDLERLAPEHYDTGRARALVAAAGPGLGALLGWILLGTVVALTLARAVGRLRNIRSRTRAQALARAAVTALAVLWLAPAARAQAPDPTRGLSSFAIDDANPEASVPAREELRKNPVDFGYLVMDLAEKAEQATRRKDYPQAVRYYRALVKLAPDRAIGHGKICEVHELAGDRAAALEACRTALRIDGVRTEDYDRFVRLLLASPQPLTQVEKDELSAIVTHLESKPENRFPAAEIQCRLGAHTGDVGLLERCTLAMASIAPADAKTINYQWALATLKKDVSGARRALDRAAQAGVTGAELGHMASVTRKAELTRAIATVVALVMVLAAACLIYFRRRELVAAFARRSAGQG